jgi:hypothetical protein
MIKERYRTSLSLLKWALLTALFFFSLTPSLWAQNRRYVTEQRFIQRLVWVGDEYAFRYEVVIERNEGEGYLEFKREFTASSELVISLPLGNYRYHVIPYDYLDQPAEASGWVMLDVTAPPAIPDETPDQSSGPEKQFDIILGAAWAPLLPISGRIQEIFEQEFYPSGAILRLGFLYDNSGRGNLGLELSTAWYDLNKAQDDNRIRVLGGITSFNIVVQAWSSNRNAALMFRVGGGVVFQIGEVNTGESSYSIGGVIPQMNLEMSFLWPVLKQFYLEIGYGVNLFMSEDDVSICFRPCLGIGWQF